MGIKAKKLLKLELGQCENDKKKFGLDLSISSYHSNSSWSLFKVVEMTIFPCIEESRMMG